MTFDHRTWAIGAHPIGAPGCPELAACTISAENTRIVSTTFFSKAGVGVDIFCFFAGAER